MTAPRSCAPDCLEASAELLGVNAPTPIPHSARPSSVSPTPGASDTINVYLFNTAFSYFHMGMASSMVVIFFAIILGISILAIRIRRATWL